MKVYYARISSEEQNEDRQIQNTEGYDYVFIDKCSGSIPLFKRPKGSQIQTLLDKGSLTSITVHQMDRLGRDRNDILNMWSFFTEQGIRIICKEPLFQNLKEDGTPDPFSDLFMAILSSIAQFEKSIINERQKQGIKIAKAKGRYKGRKVGTSESEDKFLNKPLTKRIIKFLSVGSTYKEIIEATKASSSTIYKTKLIYGKAKRLEEKLTTLYK